MEKAPFAPVDRLTGLEAARLGLYVHFPYCLSKCPYCDFASTAAKAIPDERYTQAIIAELTRRVAAWKLEGRQLDSIFIGGGTPSLWRAQSVAKVLRAVRDVLPIAKRAEITLEANPGAADAERFAAFLDAGVNRLSIGVQSFNATTLAALGRSHDGDTAERAFRKAREAGFSNVSMDFIYGVFGQTVSEVERDAQRAVSLKPDHLSAYALTLDRQSLAEEVPLAKQLARGEVTLPPDDTVVEMQRRVETIYAGAGLHRYEVSNYARPQFHSRHNALYWTQGEYLAIGVGATGFLSSVGQPFRYANARNAERYLSLVDAGELPSQSVEPIDADALFEERVAMGLRLASGVDLAAAFQAFGRSLEPKRPFLEALVANGRARWSGQALQLTPAGFDVHSEIVARLI